MSEPDEAAQDEMIAAMETLNIEAVAANFREADFELAIRAIEEAAIEQIRSVIDKTRKTAVVLGRAFRTERTMRIALEARVAELNGPALEVVREADADAAADAPKGRRAKATP